MIKSIGPFEVSTHVEIQTRFGIMLQSYPTDLTLSIHIFRFALYLSYLKKISRI